MDQRNEELLYLRKAYRREKRAATLIWKWLFGLSLVACGIFAPLAAAAFLPGFPICLIIGGWASFAIGYFPNGQEFLALLQDRPNLILIILGVGLIVFLVSVIMWISGSRKLRRTDAFLSYRTLREALREEKKLKV